MPTITSGLSPSPTGVNFTSGGGGGGVFGPGATSSGPTGTFTAYVAPAPSANYSSGSGSASSIAAGIAQGGGGGIESAFYDQRLAEIYYLGDKPWYDETRYDEFGFTTRQPNSNLRTALILAAVLLLARQL